MSDIGIEEIGELKNFRRNVMIISALTIVFIIFSNDIKGIETFIKFKPGFSIFGFKSLFALTLANLYFLWRYCQYHMTSDESYHEGILAVRLLKNYKNDISTDPIELVCVKKDINGKEVMETHAQIKENIFIWNDGSVQFLGKGYYYPIGNILSDKNPDNLTILVSSTDRENFIEEIEINIANWEQGEKKVRYTLYIKLSTLRYYWNVLISSIKDKRIMDYEIPKLLPLLSIIMITLKINQFI